jgi:redox-sensitive bicupin YhaK (pirin superfamily)
MTTRATEPKGRFVVRLASERGHFDHGWLDTNHTFSFGDYFDPAEMGFRALRVINEDRVVPGAGFPTHGHRDMEIISYVLEGAIAHRDSMGHEETLRPGEVQRMSAGTGVRHSEFNPSRTEGLHFYQIWLLTDRNGHQPEYEQKAFAEAERRGRLRLVVSPDGRDGSLRMHQDARMYATLLVPGEQVTHEIAAGRHAWVQVARGKIDAAGHELSAGDGMAVSEATSLAITAREDSEVLLFDLA